MSQAIQKKINLTKTRYFLAAALLNIETTYAAETMADSYFSDNTPIVLSATRLAQPTTEAPASVSVIDREMIKLSGAKQVAEIFRLVPGMHIHYYRGNRATIGYQGINSDYPRGVQVLIDGRSVYSPAFGGVDWANLPIAIEDIERIEVVRGANSASFGANAFQAVINITSSHSSQHSSVHFNTSLGERGYQRHFLRAKASYLGADVSISTSHTDDNGYQNNHDDSRQDFISSRIDYQINQQNSLQVNASIISSLRGNTNPANYSDPTDPRRNIDENYFSLHGKWEHQTNDKQLFISQLSYSRFNSKDKINSVFDEVFPAPIGAVNDVTTFLDTSTAYSRWDFEFEHQLEPSSSTRLTWGLGLRSEETEIPFWTNTTAKHKNSMQRIFTNLEWRPLDQVIINSSASWEHSQLSGDAFSPRIAVNYLITPKKSLRFIASHSFRAPAVVENKVEADIAIQIANNELLLPVVRGASNLDLETVDSFEIGFNQLSLSNRLALDLKVFKNEYKHLIDAEDKTLNGGTTLNGISVGPAEVKFVDNRKYVDIVGYELEVNYRHNKNNLIHLGYTHNHAKGSKDIVNSVPDDSFNLLLAHTFRNKAWTSLAFYYTGSMENLNSGNPLGPMRRLDFNIGKSHSISQGQLIEVKASLQFALDKNLDFLKEFTLENRAFIEASYTFH